MGKQQGLEEWSNDGGRIWDCKEVVEVKDEEALI